VVVKQPKFTRVEGSRHSYAITANHAEKLKRGSLLPNILLQYLMRPPPQLAAKCHGEQRTSLQYCRVTVLNRMQRGGSRRLSTASSARVSALPLPIW